MATPAPLSRPPITEALVDLRAAVPQPQEAFEAFAKELSAEFPKTQVKRAFHAELRVENGTIVPPVAQDLGFQGIRVNNADESLAVQFGPSGFTFNNVKFYIGGDRLISESLALWDRFAGRMKPSSVTRVAMRYINALQFPFRTGEPIRKYLTASPELPPEAPQLVSEFLSRVVAHDGNTTAIVTQTLGPGPAGSPAVQIDIDVFQVGEFSASSGELRAILQEIRLVKNRTFFSLLTDEAVKVYLL